MVKKNKEKKQTSNPILLFFFAIVIPFVVIIGIALFTLPFLGEDVQNWIKEKNIPVVSSLVSSKEDKQMENKLNKADETIVTQREEIEDLNKEIDSLEGIIADLEMDIKRLENRTESEAETVISAEQEEEEIKQTAASFRKMDPEKAAPIIQNLDKNIAVPILANLSGDVRGAILAEMEPKQAAELTKEMMNR
ncbi:hypothetical protein SPD48_02750 [Pseudogracilibacillus sp. SE30717A]|uniref:MotE family protein n=1 Tax=Pseudogracilibacillus sp. SE30717A TaxID=3098293 RepID=UPI00300E12F1